MLGSPRQTAVDQRVWGGSCRIGISSGSYLQVDPKVSDTWEPYAYAGNNPVRLTDSRGTSWKDDLYCVAGAGAIAVGATKFGKLIFGSDEKERVCLEGDEWDCRKEEEVSGAAKGARWGGIFGLGVYLVAKHCPDSNVVGCLILGECGGSSGSTAGCMGGPEAGCPAYFGKPAYGSPGSCQNLPIGGNTGSLFDQNGGLPEPQIPDLSCPSGKRACASPAGGRPTRSGRGPGAGRPARAGRRGGWTCRRLPRSWPSVPGSRAAR
jgi:hypothetical protein